MNRWDVINEIAAELHEEPDHVREVVDTMLAVIAKHLAAGRPVNLRTFGKLEPRLRAAVTRLTPRTHERVDVPERVTVVFVPSQNLRRLLQPESA